ncbi:hypothetical protein [Flavobacterium columnare]|uniref:DUF600 family protein n=1 Tax=Flavobacterium columnare TaxID=996 RepID=A0AA94JPR4_9FLAO|nr:hypothetical protein [Flavobacterium columnare]MCH4830026.1 hypothetical protein [Flavobacterium columnare]MCH4832593.1 hypothetical protein [Flavobacterium columnare]
MKDIIEILTSHLKEHKWKQVIIVIEITQGSIGYKSLFFIDENSKEEDFWIDFEDIKGLFDKLREEYNLSKDNKNKFNRYELLLNNDGNYSEKYWWDAVEDKKDLLSGAEVFFQWANDRMMSMIFEYEKDNNLLLTQYDNDGDLEYLSSWDRGVFTFYINENNELEYKIVLIKDGVERVSEMPLKDYFIEGVLEHHKITNTELLDVWKPWNTLIIRSPHTGIPYDKVDEYVEYKTVMS